MNKNRILIKCPSCSKTGYIDASEGLSSMGNRGVTAIHVLNNKICSHSFVAYIDKNLKLRDCFLTDYQVELPQMEPKRKIESKKIPDSDVIDVYLIKINIPVHPFIYAIKGCLNNEKVLFLNENDVLRIHLSNLFNFIFQDVFEINIMIEKRETYEDNRDNYKDFLIFDNSKIIRDKNKILTKKKIKIETMIIHKFIAEDDTKSSLIILKNEILKVFEISKKLMHLIEKYKGEKQLSREKLFEEFKETSAIKITYSYLEFILDIIRNYFKFDLSALSSYYLPAIGI